MRPTPPLILVAKDDGGIEMFDDLAQLASAVEGVDVEDGNYLAFDAVGRVIELTAQGVTRARPTVDIGTVTAGLAWPSVSRPGALAEHLRTHLRRVSEARSTPPPQDGADLTELVARCLALRPRTRRR